MGHPRGPISETQRTYYDFSLTTAGAALRRTALILSRRPFESEAASTVGPRRLRFSPREVEMASQSTRFWRGVRGRFPSQMSCPGRPGKVHLGVAGHLLEAAHGRPWRSGRAEIAWRD